MENPQLIFEDHNTPEEVKNTLIQFLGHTYKEVSNYDNHLVSPNQFLAPKKQEFQRTAERVMQEALNGSIGGGIGVGVQTSPIRSSIYPNNQPNRPFIDIGSIAAPMVNDPNQLEFSFDNSVTAKTINKKLEDIEKTLKRLDNTVNKMLDYFQSHEAEDSQ